MGKQEMPLSQPGICTPQAARTTLYLLWTLQGLVLIVSLYHLDGPFVSAHYERQNQTYDTAKHIFDDGWRDVLIPKASFSFEGYEAQRFTVLMQEFPFHGLLGWPFARVFGHERAVVRLISVVFALLSIQFIYQILRVWLEPAPALIGAAIWATAPLLLHLGSIPMPDIICTTGMLAAFHYALRGRLRPSSLCFLVAILGKSSVTPFGLPIVTALLLARQVGSARDNAVTVLKWGLAPLLALAAWISLSFLAPDTPATTIKIISQRGSWGTLADPSLYASSLVYVLPCGIGILGGLGLLFSILKFPAPFDRRLAWSIIVANGFYFLFAIRKVPEFQYFLPPVAWALIWGAQTFPGLLEKAHASRSLGWALGMLAVLHLVVSLAGTYDLKASRMDDFTIWERARQLLPPDARVIVVYPHYGASPAVWLQRNTIAVSSLEMLQERLPKLESLGFRYVLILDVKIPHPFIRFGQIKLSPKHPELRQFCDAKFRRLCQGPRTVLYAIPPT
jgi:hypothetical protein